MGWWSSLRDAAIDITGLVTTGGFVNSDGISNPAETVKKIGSDISGKDGGLFGGGDPSSNIYDPFKAYRGAFGQKLADLSMGNTQFSPSDPSYQFRYNQGLEAVNRSMAAQGQLGSGLQMKSLMDYGQASASQEYGNEWNRLASLAGVGTTMNVGQTPNALMQNLGAGLGLMQGMGSLSSLFGGGSGAVGGNIGAGLGSDFGSAFLMEGGTNFVAPETLAMFAFA